MIQSEYYIAALDLGTSKMKATIGSKDENGNLTVLASETEDSGTCMRRGCVYNAEETSKKVSGLIARLNHQLKHKIEKIYVGTGGQSLHTEEFSVSREINGETVDQELIESLYEECRNHEYLAEVLDIVSPEFLLDGQGVSNPKGVSCNKIEARFRVVLGRPSLKRSLQRSVEEYANLPIAGYIITPLATAAVLDETEKELGCALIEFGAGVTYLSIYKNGTLKYLVTIPLGGNVITKDLCSLNILEKEAESLKLAHGSAITDREDKTRIKVALRDIEILQFNRVIEARINEIIANLKEQINRSGYADALAAGIVITGGGASLPKLEDSLRSKLDKNVRVCDEKENASVLGLIASGTENCAKVIQVTQPVQTVIQTGGLFDGQEIEVVERQRKERGTRKPIEDNSKKTPEKQSDRTDEPEEKRTADRKEHKKSGGLFGKITNRFEKLSKDLFNEEDDY